MAGSPGELKKLVAIANDLELAPQLRLKAIEQLGNIGSHEALLALLDVAAKEKLTTKERELALKQAIKIVKSSH
jgi:HEAT repeat protein